MRNSNENDMNFVESQISTLIEAFPNLNKTAIFKLLENNAFDIEKTFDSALALSTTLELEKIEHPTSKENKNDISVKLSEGNNLKTPPREDNKENNRKSIKNYRGKCVLLSNDFLRTPRFRISDQNIIENRQLFVVEFYRKNDKLGITVKEIGGEIFVVSISSSSDLASSAGLIAGDKILGVNDEMFGPGTLLQDVLDILSSSGDIVKFHFMRILRAMEQFHSTTLHTSIPSLLEQEIISKGQVSLVSNLVDHFKWSVIHWNPVIYHSRLEKLELDAHHIDLNTNFDTFAASKRSSRRLSFTGYSENPDPSKKNNRPISHRRRASLDSNISAVDSLDLDITSPLPFEAKYLRPAISIKILRAEQSPKSDYYVYVIWILDVKSGIDWTVRRRFREFYELRETLVSIRSSIDSIQFPPKRFPVQETSVVEERLPALQYFLRKVTHILSLNTMHPSTIKMQVYFFRFLSIKERLDTILVKEQDPNSAIEKTTQVFFHHILHMPVIDKVLTGFTDTFLSHSIEDISKIWSEEEACIVLEEIKKFLDYFQEFLFDCFNSDCSDIINSFLLRGGSMSKQASYLMNLINVHTGIDNMNPKFETNEKKDNNSSAITDNDVSSLLQLTEDEITSNIRSAIRKQIECEIYLGCYGRITYIITQSLQTQEQNFISRLKILYSQPQSYFDIPIQYISPSSWEAVIHIFRDIRNMILPCDKIYCLVSVAKSIIQLYQVEHPDSPSTLGADDILPIFIYVVVQSQIYSLIFTSLEIEYLSDPEKRLSETGYYIATLQASISHILEADLDQEHPFQT